MRGKPRGSVSGKDRIRQFFMANVGRKVNTGEIAAIAGIRDYAKRIRELRAEEGMEILSAYTDASLQLDEYRYTGRTLSITERRRRTG